MPEVYQDLGVLASNVRLAGCTCQWLEVESVSMLNLPLEMFGDKIVLCTAQKNPVARSDAPSSGMHCI